VDVVYVGLLFEWVGNGSSDEVDVSSMSEISDKLSDKTDDSDTGEVGSGIERIDDHCGFEVIEILLSSCSEAG
jgi:hypothetical protein